jgi:hypothetical protein
LDLHPQPDPSSTSMPLLLPPSPRGSVLVTSRGSHAKSHHTGHTPKQHNPRLPPGPLYNKASAPRKSPTTCMHPFPYTRFSLLSTTHCSLRPPLSQAKLVSTKQLPSSRTPHKSAYTWVPAYSVSSSFVVPETLGILRLCLSQPLASRSREKEALRAVALPGAAAPCYTAP